MGFPFGGTIHEKRFSSSVEPSATRGSPGDRVGETSDPRSRAAKASRFSRRERRGHLPRRSGERLSAPRSSRNEVRCSSPPRRRRAKAPTRRDEVRRKPLLVRMETGASPIRQGGDGRDPIGSDGEEPDRAAARAAGNGRFPSPRAGGSPARITAGMKDVPLTVEDGRSFIRRAPMPTPPASSRSHQESGSVVQKATPVKLPV